MTDDRLEQDLRAWMTTTAPVMPRPDVLRAARARIATTPQARPWWSGLGGPIAIGGPRGRLAASVSGLSLLLVVGAVTAGVLPALRTPVPAGAATWTAVDAPSLPRHQQSLVALPDGDVLLIGGRTADASGLPVPGIERWDAATQTWSAVGDLDGAWADASAVVLTDGRVLLVNLESRVSTAPTGDAAILDPDSGVLTRAGRMTIAMAVTGDPSAAGSTVTVEPYSPSVRAPILVALPDGGALAALDRGWSEDGPIPPVLAIWDPRMGDFRLIDPAPCDMARGAATPLDDESVLLICGRPFDQPRPDGGLSGAERGDQEGLSGSTRHAIVDSASGRVTGGVWPPGPMMGAATTLTGGRILLIPETSTARAPGTAVIRDPDGSYRALVGMAAPPRDSRVTTLSDGRILFVSPWSTTAWLFDPSTEAFRTIEMPALLAEGAVAPLPDGDALVVFGPDWETPGPRREQPAPMVLDPGV